MSVPTIWEETFGKQERQIGQAGTVPAIFKVEGKRGRTPMNWKSRLLLGVFTALAMLLATFALPRGNALRDASLVQFPLTVGVWAIFVLLFVKLK
jgi:hypothetical protein